MAHSVYMDPKISTPENITGITAIAINYETPLSDAVAGDAELYASTVVRGGRKATVDITGTDFESMSALLSDLNENGSLVFSVKGPACEASGATFSILACAFTWSEPIKISQDEIASYTISGLAISSNGAVDPVTIT